MNKIIIVASIFVSSFLLSSCMLGVFTATTTAGMALAKNRTVGDTIDDVTIATKIKKAFLTEGFTSLYAKINTEVMQGRVLYTGSVETEEDMMQAVEIAWRQQGVKEVVNELTIEDYRSKMPQYLKDSYITTLVKTKIIANRNIRAVNYTIVTHRNTVYLFGVARSEEELQTAADLAAQVSGVEKVVSHIRISNSDIREMSQSEPYKD